MLRGSHQENYWKGFGLAGFVHVHSDSSVGTLLYGTFKFYKTAIIIIIIAIIIIDK